MNIIVTSDLTLGRKVRLARVAKGWRQIDLATNARVTPVAISLAERDVHIRSRDLMAILKALELFDPKLPLPEDAP